MTISETAFLCKKYINTTIYQGVKLYKKHYQQTFYQVND
jgi:hypothetical protein